MTHLDDTALVSLVDGASTHPHLESCETCRSRHAQLLALARSFETAPAADPAAVHLVMNRINRRRSPRGTWAFAAIAAAALALLTVLALRDTEEPAPTFASRGGQGAAPRVTTFVHAPPHGPRTPATPGQTLGREVGLSFRALAPPEGQPPVWLLIAACDATSTLHWAVPVWDDPTTDPHGALLDPATPLFDPPTQLHPDAPVGPLTILAITSTAPITVQTVERHVATVGCDGPALATRLRAEVAVTPLTLR